MTYRAMIERSGGGYTDPEYMDDNPGLLYQRNDEEYAARERPAAPKTVYAGEWPLEYTLCGGEHADENEFRVMLRWHGVLYCPECQAEELLMLAAQEATR